MDTVATIIGYVLFGISELLPFMNTPPNGILNIFTMGFTNAFKPLNKDIELATSLVEKPNFANIVNTISTNPQIKSLIDSIISNPQLSNTLHIITTNNTLTNQLHILSNRPQLQTILGNLISNPEFCNNIFIIDPVLLNGYIQNKDLITNLLNNKQILPLLTQQNLSILQNIDPEFVNTIHNTINNTENKQEIFHIIDTLNTHPNLIANINGLVNQAVI